MKKIILPLIILAAIVIAGLSARPVKAGDCADPSTQCTCHDITNGTSWCEPTQACGGCAGWCDGNCGSNPGSNNPKGWHDASNCTTCNGGASLIQGWTCDPENYSVALAVHVYKDGPAGGGGTMVGAYTANVDRGSGVAAECGGNPYHGFNIQVPTSLQDNAAHALYVYAINIGGGSNQLLSGSPKTMPACKVCSQGRATVSCSGAAMSGVVVNQGVTSPPGCNIGTITSDGNGYFTSSYPYGGGFCLRPPAVSGYSGPNPGSYECQIAGKYDPSVCGGIDLASDTAYNFTYTPTYYGVACSKTSGANACGQTNTTYGTYDCYGNCNAATPTTPANPAPPPPPSFCGIQGFTAQSGTNYVVNPAGTYNMTWGASAGASGYYVRLDDQTNAWYTGTTDVSTGHYNGTTYSYNYQLNHPYNMWVHAIGCSDSIYSAATSCTATVTTAPVLNALHVNPNTSDSPTSVGTPTAIYGITGLRSNDTVAPAGTGSNYFNSLVSNMTISNTDAAGTYITLAGIGFTSKTTPPANNTLYELTKSAKLGNGFVLIYAKQAATNVNYYNTSGGTSTQSFTAGKFYGYYQGNWNSGNTPSPVYPYLVTNTLKAYMPAAPSDYLTTGPTFNITLYKNLGDYNFGTYGYLRDNLAPSHETVTVKTPAP